MSKEEKRKREFYVYRVAREEDGQETSQDISSQKEEKYIISPHFGKQPSKAIPDGVGYRRDPSTYDSIRSNHGINKEFYNRYAKNSVEKEEKSFQEEVIGIENQEIIIEDKAVSPYNPLENRYVKEPEVRGEYVPLDIPEKEVSIEDLPMDVFFEREEVGSTSVQNEPVVSKPTPIVSIPRPKIATNPNLEQLEEKRTPIVDIPAPKLTKYIGPKLDMLTRGNAFNDDDKAEAERQKQLIDQTLADSNIKAEVADYIFGPTVTQFMIKVAPGVNVNSINSCAANLAMYLEAERIRIQTPIPGKPYAGIEVPKKEKYRRIVHLGDILASKEFKNTQCKIPVVVGKDNYGIPMICDIAEMPHCLIAGTTKSGKSVCLNTFIMSMIYHFAPKDLRLVLMDPKRIELSPYEEIPHLAMPVITDKEDFPAALGWVYEEMERRYKIFEYYGDRDLGELNRHLEEDKKAKLPYLVMIIDEFGDWFAGATLDVEEMIQKIAAKARAAGIHVLLATQRPSKDVIKGSIKANFDTRLAFKVSSFEDSKVILGASGAEKLEGHGDVLIKYAGKTEKRLQGAYVGNKDIKQIIQFLKSHNKCNYIVTKEEIQQSTTSRQVDQNTNIRGVGMEDERFEEVAYYIVRNKNASNNSLSRDLHMGFNRVNDILVALEKIGVVSPAVKGKQREVLVDEFQLEDILNQI